MHPCAKALRVLLLATAGVAMAPSWAQIVVKDAWVRGTVAGQSSTGAYMVVSSDRDVALVGASADIAARAAVHEMKMHGDMMMMSPIERLPIPAGHPVSLDEHGYHIMLEGLKHPVRNGDKVRLVLRFVDAKGEPKDITVEALGRPLNAGSEPAGHEHHETMHGQ